VTVRTEPPGATVLLGDRVQRNSPVSFPEVEPGKYLLRVMLPGYEPQESRVEIGRQQPFPLVKLQRSTGGLQVETEPPGASFELTDGASLVRSGTAPAALSDLPTGHYELAARRGPWELREPVEVLRNETALKKVAFATGALSVESEPPGSEILADGKVLGRAPLKADLSVGLTRSWPVARDGATRRRPSRLNAKRRLP